MLEKKYINVSSDVLVWARTTMALTKNQVCERTNLTLLQLNQLESGEKQPTLDEIKILSKTYKRTIATLLLNKPPKEKPLPKDMRTINSQSVGVFHEKTIMAIRKARALIQDHIELSRQMGIKIPKFKLSASFNDSPKNIANEVRRILNLNEVREIKNINTALELYIEKVENLGVAVFQLSLIQDNIRGFSITDEAIPIIGIKRGNEQTHSKIFTLFHELGHLILNEGGICDLSETTNSDIEKWCNAFSSELLIPTQELLRIDKIIEQQRINNKIWLLKDLALIGNHFHVGPLALLRSLLENNLTTKAFYQEKHESWNKPSFGRAKIPEGRNIPKETIKERGKQYISLAFLAFDQNRIGLKDLSDFLGIKLSYIPKTRLLLNA